MEINQVRKGEITMSWKEILKGHPEKEHIMISDPYENSSNQKEIKVYWMFGDGGEGEDIATFTDKKLEDIYDWIEHWAKKNGHSDKEIHQE